MIQFKIGVDIEKTCSTTIVVGVKAETREEAEQKVLSEIRKRCREASINPSIDIEEVLGLNHLHESDWSDCDNINPIDINHDEDWGSGLWDADFEV